MQEQPQYNITPEQGWSGMRSILDKAMPVTRRNRRFVFFWRSVSAVLIAGVLGMVLYTGTDVLDPVPQGRDGKDQPGQQMTPTGETPHEKTKENTQPVLEMTMALNSSPQASTEVLQSTRNINAPSKVSSTAPGSLQANPDATTMDHDESTTPVMTSGQNEILRINGMVHDDHDASDLVLVSEEVPGSKENAAWVTPSLPGLMMPAFTRELSELNMDITPLNRKDKSRTHLFEPYLAISGMMGHQGGVGAYGGAGLHVNVNRRLSFTTAMGYRSFYPSTSLFGKTQDLNDANSILNHDPLYEGIETYIDGLAVSASTGYNIIDPLVERVRQWQWSGGLQWKWNKRLYTEAGVAIGFETRASSEFPIISNDFSGVPSVRIGKSLNSYDVVRSTMTSLYGGIGYQLGGHLAVFAQWTHGLDSYLLNETRAETVNQPLGEAQSRRSDFIRGLNVGMKYVL